MEPTGRDNGDIPRGGTHEFDVDTASFEPARRPAEWAESLAGVIGAVEVEVSDEAQIAGRLLSLQIGDCTILSVESNAFRARRTQMHIRSGEVEPRVMLAHQLSGLSVTRQKGHTVLLRPGEFIATRLDQPSELIVNGHHERVAVVLPAALLEGEMEAIEALQASAIGATDGAARMLHKVLEGFYFNRGLGGPFDRISAGAFVRDLVAGTLRTHGRPQLRSQDRTLADALSFIEHNLRDPDLTPAVVAASHFMSVRSLQMLFRPHGWTPSGWIRHRRLVHARQELELQEDASTVANIAARWGFIDPAHFSKLFRQAAGVGPRDYRKQVREGRIARADDRGSSADDFFRTAGG